MTRRPRRTRSARDYQKVFSPSVIPAGPFIRDIPTYDLVSEDKLNAIHEASMRVLEDVGIEFRDDTALATWRGSGAAVTGACVRIPSELC